MTLHLCSGPWQRNSFATKDQWYITFDGIAVLSCFCHPFISAGTNVELLDLDWELVKIKRKIKIIKYFPFGFLLQAITHRHKLRDWCEARNAKFFQVAWSVEYNIAFKNPCSCDGNIPWKDEIYIVISSYSVGEANVTITRKVDLCRFI